MCSIHGSKPCEHKAKVTHKYAAAVYVDSEDDDTGSDVSFLDEADLREFNNDPHFLEPQYVKTLSTTAVPIPCWAELPEDYEANDDCKNDGNPYRKFNENMPLRCIVFDICVSCFLYFFFFYFFLYFCVCFISHIQLNTMVFNKPANTMVFVNLINNHMHTNTVILIFHVLIAAMMYAMNRIVDMESFIQIHTKKKFNFWQKNASVAITKQIFKERSIVCLTLVILFYLLIVC